MSHLRVRPWSIWLFWSHEWYALCKIVFCMFSCNILHFSSYFLIRLPDFFPVLRKLLEDKLSYKYNLLLHLVFSMTHIIATRYKEMWKILDKKSRHSCYGGNQQGSALRLLVVGGGPVGLRWAISSRTVGNFNPDFICSLRLWIRQ